MDGTTESKIEENKQQSKFDLAKKAQRDFLNFSDILLDKRLVTMYIYGLKYALIEIFQKIPTGL